MSFSHREEMSEEKQEAGLAPEEVQRDQALKIRELETSLTTKAQEAEVATQRLLRLGADFDNYKKRIEREQEEFRKFAQAQLIKDLLPVLDNLERAMETANSTLSTPQQALASGLELVWKQFKEVLGKAGVEEIPAEGERFDPNRHEAVEVQYTDTHPDGTLIAELQKGYLLHGKMLRPAKVVVAKNPASAAD